jgi:5-methylcytosine-specific restriction endonuclease McrA
MKTCPKCEKPGRFYRSKHTKDGLTSQCAECMKAYSAQRYADNPARQRASCRASYRRTPLRYKVRSEQWRRENPERYSTIQRNNVQRRRARLALVECTLTPAEWLAILEYFGHACAYCLRMGLPLEQEHVIPISRGGGHTANNVIPACRGCNAGKLDKPIFMMAAT